jgi:hypothetical protein
VRVPGHPPPEIVQWLAWRPATSEAFSAIVAPRAPLAPSVSLQLRIDAATLTGGEAWGAFRARWEAFVRDDDILCGWGHFPTGTLAREEIRVPAARLDARLAANAWLGARIGTAEACARRREEAGRRDAPAPAPATLAGRGGVRMDALRRIVGALLRLPDAPPGQPGVSP